MIWDVHTGSSGFSHPESGSRIQGLKSTNRITDPGSATLHATVVCSTPRSISGEGNSTFCCEELELLTYPLAFTLSTGQTLGRNIQVCPSPLPFS